MIGQKMNRKLQRSMRRKFESCKRREKNSERYCTYCLKQAPAISNEILVAIMESEELSLIIYSLHKLSLL